MVCLRMNRKLQARVDPSDVVQEAYLQATKGLDDYLSEPKLPPYLWLRQLTGKQLLAIHRHHLGTGMRDAGREISIDQSMLPDADSASMAIQIVDRGGTPSHEANRADEVRRLQEALDGMSPLDREIIALRYFEGLDNTQAAQVLDVSPSAASSRFFRALKRFGSVLREHGFEEA
jgi:RNA polymerase sigma-70 factor (ECF subfamily)